MNKDKIIKDLKERNEKLSNQYRLRDIRCVHLEKENAMLKEEINKISKKELKVRDMLYSIEYGTLTRERLMQIEEVLFELGGDVDDE